VDTHWQSQGARIVPASIEHAIILSTPTPIENTPNEDLYRAVREAKAASRQRNAERERKILSATGYPDYDVHMDRYIQWRIWRFQQQQRGGSISKYEFLGTGVDTGVINGSTWPNDPKDRRDELKRIIAWLHMVEGGGNPANESPRG